MTTETARTTERTRSGQALPVFDCVSLFRALDEQRNEVGIDWWTLADHLWEQSEVLNARLEGAKICGGAVQRIPIRKAISCQYAVFMLRWLRRTPEDFLTGPVHDVGRMALPEAGPDRRLRWDLSELHAELNAQRAENGLTWKELGHLLGCTPARLTNLRTARLADMDLVMRITQWLGQPAATFIHPAEW